MAIRSAIAYMVYHLPHFVCKITGHTKIIMPKVLEILKYNIFVRPEEVMLWQKLVFQL